MSRLAAVLVFASWGLMIGGLYESGVACLVVAAGIFLAFEVFV